MRLILPFLHSLVLLFLVAAPSSLRAQNTAKPAPFQFSCVSFEDLGLTGLLYREGENFLPLEVKSRNRSAPVPLRGMKALEIHTRAADVDGKPQYKLVGKSAIPANTKLALFLVFERPSADGLPLTLLGIDDSLKTFPPGTFRFANFTPVPLRVLFGGINNKIQPGALTVVPSKVSKDGGFLPFLITDSKGQHIYENRLWSQVSGRDMLFIGPPPAPGGRVSVMLLPQIVAPPPAE